MKIRRIDSRRDDIRAAMAALREKLSPRGDVVSQSGRQRTIEVFGRPLSPAQVVDRICRDVAEKGLAAVLEYTARIDKVQLTAQTVRVPQAELEQAHAQADPQFLQALRRVRENIRVFQDAILQRDVRVERPGGYLIQRYRPLDRVGICVPGGAAAYPSSVLMTAVPAQVAGVKQLAFSGPAHKIRLVQCRHACHLPRVGHNRSISAGRRPGRGRVGLRRGGNSASRQNRRSRQSIRGTGEKIRLRRGGHRFYRRPQRSGGHRRRFHPARLHRLRPDRPGRARARGKRVDRLEPEGSRRGRGGAGKSNLPRSSGAILPGKAWKILAR